MKLRTAVLTAGFLGMVSAAHADITADINQTKANIRQDSVLLSKWFSDLMADAAPYNSTTGAVIPKQLKLWGFEIGVLAGASGTEVDVSGLRALPTTVVNTDDIDMVDTFPMPTILAHAKVGLPWGLDLGFRAGGIPETEVDEGDTTLEVDNTVFGIDLRKALIEEGVTRPFGLTVGLNYTRAKGDMTIVQPYSANSTITEAGTTYNATMNATGRGTSSWETQSAGAQVILNKQILFFNPYIGGSVNKNWGDADTTLNTAGSVTIVQANNTSNSRTDTFNETGAARTDIDSVDARLLAGFELNPLPFLKFGVYGEYAGSENLSGTLGLRVQFR